MMFYLIHTKAPAFGYAITMDLREVASFAQEYKTSDLKVCSFNTLEQVYGYFGWVKACEELNNGYGKGFFAMPSMEAFKDNHVYEEESVKAHMPPWGISIERYYAIIVFNVAIALVDGIDGLMDLLVKYNGMPVTIEDFCDSTCAQNWLKWQISVSLMPMAAYGRPVKPVIIPEVGQELPFPELEYYSDMSNIQYQIFQLNASQYEEVEYNG